MARPREKPEEKPETDNTVPVLIPTAIQLGIVAHYRGVADCEDSAVATTLDLRERANVLLCQRALALGSESLWDQPPDKVIAVEHLIRHYAEAEDEETGEVRGGPMLTLVGPGGVYHTMSQYAFRDIQRISILIGPPPWHPPILIRAARTTSRNKREFQSVILAE